MIDITQTTINFKVRNRFRINTAKFVVIRMCLVADATVLASELLLCSSTDKITVCIFILL